MTKQEPVKTFWVCACRPEAGRHISANPRSIESKAWSKSRSTEGRGREFDLSKTWNRFKQPWQQSCQECGKSQMDLKEIVVPSGLGGVFAVEVQHIDRDQARVKVINNSNGFGALPPFKVSLSAIQPRWKKRENDRNDAR